MFSRQLLVRGVRLCVAFIGIAIVFVMSDFLVDSRPDGVHSSYQFKLVDLPYDQPVILHQDNLSILVIRRSEALINQLHSNVENLQDPESLKSRQPQAAQNTLRSLVPEYFVSYAMGTDLGCPIDVDQHGLKEICGKAYYDFAGRAKKGTQAFANLSIPEYTLSSDFNSLTIKP
ncbi:MAG: hypothetical protein AAF353_03425 [Pseudomonadota bacterium]